ncbi:MAG: hypothetical protein FJX52_14175 [Alphaproteobacteria bacterium]|nr:hypothetical protein [Alphaproteobacteria bacterium]
MDRRQALLFSATAIAALTTSPVWAAQGIALPREAFVEGVEDVPLMPGLTNVEAAGLAFDTPQGRIVVAYASGSVERDAVLTFYAATLPQLGWVRERDGRYRRDAESLSFEFSRTASGLTVRITLSPVKQ